MKLTALAVMLLFVPLAGGQGGEPEIASVTLYAAHSGSGNQFSGWLTGDRNDPKNDAAAVGGPIPEDCVALDVGCEWKAFDFTWEFTLSPPITEPYELSGDLEIVAYLGSGSGSGSGIDVSSRLLYGSQLVASTSVASLDYQSTGAGRFTAVSWTIPVEQVILQPGSDLKWIVNAKGADGEAEEDLLLGTSYLRGRSGVTLPVVIPEPEPVATVTYHDLEGETVNIDQTFQNVSSESHVYNWSNPNPDVELSWSIDGTGDVFVTAVLNGSALPRSKVSGNNTLIIDRGAGEWSVRIDLYNFDGRVQLRVSPVEFDPVTGKPVATLPSLSQDGSSDGGGEAEEKPERKAPKLGIFFIAGAGVIFLLLVGLLLGRRA